jgi:hypothetical protein
VATAVPQVDATVYDTVTAPAVRPLTTPLPFTVATAVLLLLHVPPEIASDNVIVLAAQTVVGPVIVPAVALLITDTPAVVVAVPQLVVIEYVMVAAPAVIPRNTPVAATMLATEALLVDQVPPDTALDKVVTEPTHTAVVPEIVPAEGPAFTAIL